MGHPLSVPEIDVPSLLKQYNLRPDKSLGQNFLIDPHYLEQVAEAGNISNSDTVLEIGAGLGNLTRHLAERANLVLAVEIDPDLIPILKKVTSSEQNIEIIQDDILKIDLKDLVPSDGYVVVANIPYYITSNLIRHLTSSDVPPQRMVLTVQKEVAERIIAQSRKLSLLALSIRVYGNPSLVSKVPAGAFYPVPKVDSAILRVDLFPSPLVPKDLVNIFFNLAKAGFSQKRKKLRNSLSAGMDTDKGTVESLLAAAKIDANRRAETLSLEEWVTLTDIFSRFESPTN